MVGSPETIGRRAKAAIRKTVDLTAPVGIGPNRLIAKLASDYQKSDGLTVAPPNGVSDFLNTMPLTVLRGVGAKTAQRLEQLNVTTVSEVRRLRYLDGKVLIHCHAGCDTEAVLAALGLGWSALYPDRWESAYHRATCGTVSKAGVRRIERAMDPLNIERTILRIAAADIETGKPLSVEDRARIEVARQRIIAVTGVQA